MTLPPPRQAHLSASTTRQFLWRRCHLQCPSQVAHRDQNPEVNKIFFAAVNVLSNFFLALSPHMHDFSGNFFDFDRCSASSLAADYQSGNWSTTSSISPSPSFSNLDSLDVKPIISRGPSPIRGEGEKVDRRRFPCMVIGCERKFTSQYTLKVHMEAHKPKPRVSFPCTEGCSERFSRQHDRLRHEVAKHGKVCEFLCDDCGRFFSTKKTLGNHKCPVAQGSTRWVTS